MAGTLCSEQLLERLCFQSNSGQILSQTIVQFVADAASFIGADFEHLLFQLLAFGDVAFAALNANLSAAFVAHWSPGARTPFLLAGLCDQSKFHIRIAFATKEVPPKRQHARLIVGMDPVDKLSLFDFGKRIA